jgi:hypothetical protein
MTIWATIRAATDRLRRNEQAPAIIIVGMVMLGCFLSLFGAGLAEDFALLLIGCAAGLFATLTFGKGNKRR